MQHDLTFEQIKARIELPELLVHYGYQLKKGENLARGKWHVFEGDDTLVTFRGRGGEWMYFNTQDDRDKGSVIDWMKNRVTSGRIAGLAQLPGRNVWQSVNDHFRAYLNMPAEQRPKLELPTLAPLPPGEKFQSLFTENCRPLTDTRWLESRGITAQTWNNPQFEGRIFNNLFTVQKEGMKPITYTNTAFPAYHEGQVVGLEIKGEGIKSQAPNSQFARSLWLSRPPGPGKPTPALLVTESALDSLSYAQLHPQERNLYASTSGVLTQNKIYEIKRLVAAEGLAGVKAGFDNDVRGHHFDTRLLAGLAGELNPMKVVRDSQHLLSVEVHAGAGHRGIEQLMNRMRTYNAATTRDYQELSGEKQQTSLPATLRDELVNVTKTSPTTYQFHIPMSVDALRAFNQAAVQTLQFQHRVELVKATVGKDWNEQLKHEQTQQVVQRTFPEQQPPKSDRPAPGAAGDAAGLQAAKPDVAKPKRRGPSL